MSNSPMPVPSDPQAIGKATGAASAIIGKIGEFFGGKRSNEFESGHGGAGTGSGPHYEFIEKMSNLMHEQETAKQASAQAHEINVIKAKGSESRKNLKLTSKLAGESKSNTKKVVQAGADGSMTVSHTVGAAAKQKTTAAPGGARGVKKK